MVCTYLTENEISKFSQCEDEDVNEVLQEVRKISPVWFVDQRTEYQNRWFRKPLEVTTFNVYENYQYPHGNFSLPEVRCQMSCNTKANVLNFLYGLNVGYHFVIDNNTLNTPPQVI